MAGGKYNIIIAIDFDLRMLICSSSVATVRAGRLKSDKDLFRLEVRLTDESVHVINNPSCIRFDTENLLGSQQ